MVNKKNDFGYKSLICLIAGSLCIMGYFIFYANSEIIGGILFYSGIIIEVISFILGLIGLIKDEGKIVSTISIALLIILILSFLYYINFIIPKETIKAINSWQSSWGIKVRK